MDIMQYRKIVIKSRGLIQQNWGNVNRTSQVWLEMQGQNNIKYVQ